MVDLEGAQEAFERVWLVRLSKEIINQIKTGLNKITFS